MCAFSVEPLDLSNDLDVLAASAVCSRSLSYGRDDFAPMPDEDRVAVWRTPSPDHKTSMAVYRNDQQLIVGLAKVTQSTSGPNQDPWIDIHVDPQHRRQGIGTELCCWALSTVEDGTKQVYAWSLLPETEQSDSQSDITDLPSTDASVRLSQSFNFEASAIGLASSLTLPLSDSALDALTKNTQALQQGYKLASFVDGLDDQYIKETGVLKGLIDVEAPTGDITWEAEPVTPEAYRAYLQELADSGQHTVETIALAPDGSVVAQTQVVLSKSSDATMQVLSTLVRHDHRGKGLGRLIKADNIRTIQQYFPDHRRLATSSESTNTQMLTLNHEFGFRTTARDVVWRKKFTQP